MNAVSLGPIVMAADRFAVILGIFAFIIVTGILARRIEDGADPASVLALTFSRKAAEQLRDRVTARLGRTTGAALCQTFHSFAYGLIRSYSPTGLYDAPLRLLSAPEADVVLRELLNDSPESVRWPESLQRALDTHGFVREVHAVLRVPRHDAAAPAGPRPAPRTTRG